MPDPPRDTLQYPFDPFAITRRKRSLRRRLLEQSDLLDKRIAILGGSTTSELRDVLELFLLDAGIRPAFYESDFDRVFEEGLYANPRLEAFDPEIIWIHTSFRNLSDLPGIEADSEGVERRIAGEVERYRELWRSLSDRYRCPLIQNNFELPPYRLTGSLDAVDHRGWSRFVSELNLRFAEHARDEAGLHIHDLNYTSAVVGLDRWYDDHLWYVAKYAMSYEAIPYVASGVAAIVRALLGRSSKCLVLDLDNTAWGGVIGEDGPDGIRLGLETPEGEAHHALQRYAKELRARGVILAVCSKNDEDLALEGLGHPDGLLGPDDFAAFEANWDPKSENLVRVAETIGIGVDSLVFADDNPAERALVRAQVPTVRVPEIGDDPARFVRVLDRGHYFETVSLSGDDLSRSEYYRQDADRTRQKARFASYDDFLASLDMRAEIDTFRPVYVDRIAQLTNKTNQFNLTTRRYQVDQIRRMASDPDRVTLYGRLADRFGDNGLVSVVVGVRRDREMEIDLWLMSCRVLRRGFELAMFDALVDGARSLGVATLRGTYVPTPKNGLVRDFYSELGFRRETAEEDGETSWSFEIPPTYEPRNTLIRVTHADDTDPRTDSDDIPGALR